MLAPSERVLLAAVQDTREPGCVKSMARKGRLAFSCVTHPGSSGVIGPGMHGLSPGELCEADATVMKRPPFCSFARGDAGRVLRAGRRRGGERVNGA